MIEDHALQKLDCESVSQKRSSRSEIPSYLTKAHLETIQKINETSFITNNSQNQNVACLLTFDHPLTKEERKKFHQFVRDNYPLLESETRPSSQSNQTTIYLLKRNQEFRKFSLYNSTDITLPNADKMISFSRRWNDKLGAEEYNHFTAIKTSLTTNEMLHLMSEDLHLPSNRFSYCGNKDANAITFQRFSIWHLSKQVLGKLNNIRLNPFKYKEKILKNRGDYLIRDIQPSTYPLTLGNLQGNLFIITLRSLKDERVNNQESVKNKRERILTNLRSNRELKDFCGFPNYFGHQRFGSRFSLNPLIAKFIVNNDYRSAVITLLLSPSTNEEIELGGMTISVIQTWINEANNHLNLTNYADNHFNMFYFERIRSYYIDYVKNIEEKIHHFEQVLATTERKELPITYQKLLLRLHFLLDLLSNKSFPSQRFPPFLGFPQKKLLQTIQQQFYHKTLLSNNSSDERHYLYDLNYHNIFHSSLSSELKLLFLNSYQSLVFNELLRYRLYLSDQRLAPNRSFAKGGDFVLVDDTGKAYTNQEIYEQNWSNSSTSSEVKTICLNADQIPLINSSSARLRNCCIAGKHFYVKEISKEDEEKQRYLLSHIVLPLPGTHTSMNTSFIQSYFEQSSHPIISWKELANSLCNCTSSFALAGAWRHVFSQASNLKLFNDESNDWICLHDEESIRGSFPRLVKEKFDDGTIDEILSQLSPLKSAIALPSSLLRPLKKKKDEKEVIRGSKPSDSDNVVDSNSSDISDNSDVSDSRDYLCRLSFSLSTSSYATVFLDHLLTRIDSIDSLT